MAKPIAIGAQDFASLRERNCFYVDKTPFIKEWWDSEDAVTLIARPRRFGKTLNMSMLDYFFSNKYPDRGDLFEGLKIWEEEKFRKLQGTYPVIFLSFAGVKQITYENTRAIMNDFIGKLFQQYAWVLKDEQFTETDRKKFAEVGKEMDDTTAALSLYSLCEYLYRYYGKKVIVLLDEYDAPMQEAYVNGFGNYLYAHVQGLRIRAGMPIHEMRTWVLIKFLDKGA